MGLLHKLDKKVGQKDQRVNHTKTKPPDSLHNSHSGLSSNNYILGHPYIVCLVPIYFFLRNKHRSWQMESHKDSIRAICLPNGSSDYQPVILVMSCIQYF